VDAEVGAKSLVRVVDAAPRQLPAPEAIARALDVLEKAERPLVILGKGAAYSQADADIRAFIERTGIPFLADFRYEAGVTRSAYRLTVSLPRTIFDRRIILPRRCYIRLG
jgi:thiamine pyrophosphate-dependent acetolactate synthase large subunit-like protein